LPLLLLLLQQQLPVQRSVPGAAAVDVPSRSATCGA
jgi:hypothetical protein